MVGNYSEHTIRFTCYMFTLTFTHISMQAHLRDLLEMRRLVQNTEAMGMFLFPDFKPEHPDFPSFIAIGKHTKGRRLSVWYKIV